MPNSYLNSVRKQFQYYKCLGENTFDQLSEEQLFWQPDQEVNSIAVIVKHMAGNMLSRWTNFLHEDGEKSWRDRDGEFENSFKTKEDIVMAWNQGWACLFDAINPIQDGDLESIVYIRNHGHTVTEAMNRQLAHYSYHVGQIVLIGKMLKKENWISLSIPKNKSLAYNKEKFTKEKRRTHFTDDL